MKRLEEIRVRLKKATPGPWVFERVGFDDGSFAYERSGDLIQISEHSFEKPMKAKFDSDLIAHAPSDLADLCEALEVAIETIEDISGSTMDDYAEKTADEGMKKIESILAVGSGTAPNAGQF